MRGRFYLLLVLYTNLIFSNEIKALFYHKRYFSVIGNPFSTCAFGDLIIQLNYPRAKTTYICKACMLDLEMHDIVAYIMS